MIARLIIPTLLIILLSDFYIYLRYFKSSAWWWRVIWWLPGLCVAAYGVWLSLQPGFIPGGIGLSNIFLFLLGLIVIPKTVFVICSIAGTLTRHLTRRFCGQRRRNRSRNYGTLVGLVGAAAVWYVLFYGTFVGFGKLEVRHVDFYSPDVPAAFDGYRIVQFSDAHVGTLTGSRRQLLSRAVDSIIAQKADMIVFTGDLQNVHPNEIIPMRSLLSRLKAPDGVYSVMGNHDYPEYIKTDEFTKFVLLNETIQQEDTLGWTLLLNRHRIIRRGQDSLVIAGMENDGEGRFPQKGNITSTLRGLHRQAFVVMLEHDPSCWRRKILPHSQAQLTLSGHTHAMQFLLFGFSPAQFRYREWGGIYYAPPAKGFSGKRALHVTTGLGGLIPFRFGIPGEIVVITLKKDK